MNKSNSSSGQIRPHIVMTLFGRCGSLFVHSLFDGHPLLSTIPGIAATQILIKAILNPERASLSTNDLAVWVTEQVDVQFNNPNLRQLTGFDRMGENADEVLSIDPNIFHHHVLSELAKREGMTIFPRLNEAIHDAFDLIRYGSKRSQIFFHVHTFSHKIAHQFLAEIPDHRQFLLLREPVENVESFVNTMTTAHEPCLWFFYAVMRDMVAYQSNEFEILGNDSVIVRFEDIKAQPEATLRALCEAITLPFDSSLLQSSFMGKAYISPPTTRNPQIKGFEEPSTSPQGYRLSQRDRAFFATLFSGIRHWAGYGVHETLSENEMRAIIEGDLLEVEIDIAAREGIAKEVLQGNDKAIAFRQFLGGIPNIYKGPPTKIASRLITVTKRSE